MAVVIFYILWKACNVVVFGNEHRDLRILPRRVQMVYAEYSKQTEKTMPTSANRLS